MGYNIGVNFLIELQLAVQPQNNTVLSITHNGSLIMQD